MTGAMFVLAMRANLGFAIVCMVIPSNDTGLIRQKNFTGHSLWIGNSSTAVLMNSSIAKDVDYRICGSEEMSTKSLIGQVCAHVNNSDCLFAQRATFQQLLAFYIISILHLYASVYDQKFYK